MLIFETILGLLLGAALLSMLAGRIGVPYPTLLAAGGMVVALLPGMPDLQLPAELILALFVAPILLDAAHDASLRDLRANWRPVLSLVFVAVGLTTVAVALVARWFFPEMPWAAAIALGAMLAPPDAVAALAVLRQVEPPHRVRTILEGESLLNDATSLLIYKVALGAVAAGSFSLIDAVPPFAAVMIGSVAAGWAMAKLVGWLTTRIGDGPTATIVQFVVTFGVWLLAERLELSGVVTIVVFGLTAARRATLSAATLVRVTSFATWETLTFVLNVLAFTLIGLQLKPTVEAQHGFARYEHLIAAIVLLAVVMVVRLAWVLVYGWSKRRMVRSAGHGDGLEPWGQAAKNGLLIGWSGMRGIVTLAAALAVPAGFPYRDFILLAAFTVVLGTLLIQGLTLGPLLRRLKMPHDDTIEREMALARGSALKAAMAALEGDDSPAAERLRLEYRAALQETKAGRDPRGSADNRLRQRILPDSRRALDDLRNSGRIGDDAYRAVEAELDWLELSAGVTADLEEGESKHA